MGYNCEILADSKNPQGDRITTMKITFPRFILAELNTHRMFSRNSASSRAIPFKKMVKMVQENPFIPIAWQKDHKGMQGTEYFTNELCGNFNEETKRLGLPDELVTNLLKRQHLEARHLAVIKAKNQSEIGLTKQLCNRLLEPFMWHTVIVTATEWENFFNLRCPQYTLTNHSPQQEVKKYRSQKDAELNFGSELTQCAKELGFITCDQMFWLSINKSQADIHIQAIAELMWDAMNESKPKELEAGQWHIPFGDNLQSNVDKSDFQKFYYNQDFEKDEEILKVKIAIARCARISYETLGDDPKINYVADLKLFDILSKSGHWSPFEHVARAMTDEEYRSCINGVDTIKDIFGSYFESKYRGWCRNFKGFIQYRAVLD